MRGEDVAEGRQLPVRVGDALRRAGGPGGEEDGGGIVRTGAGRKVGGGADARDVGEAVPDAEGAGRHGGERRHRDAQARPTEHPRGGEAGEFPDDDVGPGAAHGAGEALQAEPGVGDDDDRPDAQARVDDGRQGRARRHEEGDAVAPAHAEGGEPCGEGAHAVIQLPPAHPADDARGAHLDDGGRVVGPAGVEAFPQRGPRGLRALSGRLFVLGLGEPGQHGGGVVAVFGDEVPGAFEAVDVGLRHPLDEVVEVPVAEDRVAGAPEHQGGNRQSADAVGDPLQLGEALMAGVDGDVGDEPADGAAALGGAVRRAERRLHLGGQRRGCQREGGVEEGRGLHRRDGEHAPRPGEAERCGDRHPLGVVHGGVQERDAGEKLGVVDRPPERDHAAPVVPEGHDRPREPEGVGEGGEVGDALRERARDVGALGEAHVELVDGDDPPRGLARLGGRERARDDAPPQVRPRRVAVHRKDRPPRGDAESCEFGAGVEDVPGARHPLVRPSAGNGDEARESGVESGKAFGGQCGRRTHRPVTRPVPSSRCSAPSRRP